MKVTKKKLSRRTGGTLIEYTFIAVFVTMAISAMSTQVTRAIAQTQGKIEKLGLNY